MQFFYSGKNRDLGEQGVGVFNEQVILHALKDKILIVLLMGCCFAGRGCRKHSITVH
jgi:hypothetical protein